MWHVDTLWIWVLWLACALTAFHTAFYVIYMLHLTTNWQFCLGYFSVWQLFTQRVSKQRHKNRDWDEPGYGSYRSWFGSFRPQNLSKRWERYHREWWKVDEGVSVKYHLFIHNYCVSEMMIEVAARIYTTGWGEWNDIQGLQTSLWTLTWRRLKCWVSGNTLKTGISVPSTCSPDSFSFWPTSFSRTRLINSATWFNSFSSFVVVGFKRLDLLTPSTRVSKRSWWSNQLFNTFFGTINRHQN